jgi:hypothetical protein
MQEFNILNPCEDKTRFVKLVAWASQFIVAP